MTTEGTAPTIWRERTAWASNRSAPLRAFLRTEAGSAGLLVAATVAAMVWVNVAPGSYHQVWSTDFTVGIGHWQLTRDLQTWIDSGLMTFFFLVVGLEARREFDLGDLRDRRRFLLPLCAGVMGMVVPVLIYLLINRTGGGAHGWGVAMSTDTALALGLLALIGRQVPERVRVFLLTVFVVDDIVALVVIAIVYSEKIMITPLIVAVALFAFLLLIHACGVRHKAIYFLLGVLIWGALLRSGVDPVVAGLAIGLTVSAYTPSREALDRATGLVRRFREQPTVELARTATTSLRAALSPNERLEFLYHPWTSYVIVPLFALANIGISINMSFLAHAYTTPITLGVLIGYLVGKPVAVFGTSWLVSMMTRGRVRPPVGWGAVLGSGSIAGIGFTVALLIATRAFHGEQLAEAKLGALSAAIVASVVTWSVYRVIGLLPTVRRSRALLGDADVILDLEPEVDVERDHFRGPATASVTIVEYGDFQCPYCGRAEPVVRDLMHDADLRYVWRHLPLTDVHPQAQLAAEASEAAAAQGRFWEMHDLLLDHQDELKFTDLLEYARHLGLDEERFSSELMDHAHVERISADLDSADLSGVSGTPTFFINGQRHYGAYDIETLKAAVKSARLRVLAARPRRPEESPDDAVPAADATGLGEPAG